MVRGFYQQLVRLLKGHGCEFVRNGKGDHEIWFSPLTGRTIAVDRHCQSRHTANAVLKQAGIPQKL